MRAQGGRTGFIGQVRALPPERGGVTLAIAPQRSPNSGASMLRARLQLHVEKPIGLNELIGGRASLAPTKDKASYRIRSRSTKVLLSRIKVATTI